jgi:chitodextrinase
VYVRKLAILSALLVLWLPHFGSSRSQAAGGLTVGYSFSEGAGTITSDASGSSISGRLVNGPLWTAGRTGNGLSFNGTSSYVDLGNPTALQITGSLTLSAWIFETANAADDAQIIAKSDSGSGWQLKSTPDVGARTFGIAVTSTSGGRAQRYSRTVRALNTWYHVAGVYDAAAGTLNIYVNGALDNGVLSGAVPASILNSPVNANIGRRAAGFYLNGVVDDVRVYSRALSPTEIQSDMNTPLGGTVVDVTPPVIANGSPAGVLPSGTTGTTLSVSTDESATCRYATVAGTSYGSMTSTFASTGGTAHAQPITGLTNGASRQYYVRCSDALGNANAADYSIAFSVGGGVSIVINPPTATLPPDGAQPFTCSVTNAVDTSCAWWIQEGSAGGSLDAITATSATYVAPSVPGTYHLLAVSNADPLQRRVAAITVTSGPAFPVKASANKRYLVDQNNVPFLIRGDTAHGIVESLTQAEVETFLANREAHGINAFWMRMLCDFVNCRTFTDNLAPFRVEGDVSTPNDAYFAKIDYVIQTAALHHQVVMLGPAHTPDWLPALRSGGLAKARAYGRYLGNRYRLYDNVIWVHGNDFDWTNSTDDALLREIALGIKDFDTRHIHSVELNVPSSGSLDDPSWAPIIDLNASYAYTPTYAQVITDYNRANFIPTFLIEANYEDANNTGQELATPQVLRLQAYRAQLSGATGQLYGNYYVRFFDSTWRAHLDSPGIVQFGYLNSLLLARQWYNLVPDQAHELVTAGYGTFSTTGTNLASTYLTAALTPDGTLAMAYTPSVRAFTVNMAKLSGPVAARWFDPASGTFVNIAGSPLPNSGLRQFTPPGNNADGKGDWLLLLEVGGPPDTTPPSVPTNLTAAGVSSSQINLTWTASTDDRSVAGYHVFRNGQPLGTSALANFSDTGLAAQTAYTYNVAAVDSSGNLSAQSTSAVGTTLAAAAAPTVSLSAPTANAVVSGTSVTVSADTTGSPIAGVQFLLDGSSLGVEDTTAPYSMAWNTTTASNGSHSLSARVRNAAGDSGTAASVPVVVDNQAPIVSVPGFVQQVLVQSNQNFELGNGFVTMLPNPVLRGNAVIVAITYAQKAGRTVAISDNIGTNTWSLIAGPSNDPGGTFSSAIYASLNTAAGTQRITVTFDAPLYAFQAVASEWYNIAPANALDGRVASSTATAPTVAAGTITTTQPGDLIYQYGIDIGWGSAMEGNRFTGYTAGPGFKLLSADRRIAVVQQYAIQATSGVITPTFTATGGGGDRFSTLAVALKAAAAGTAPDPTAMRIVSTYHTRVNAGTPSVNFPTIGNLFVITTAYHEGQEALTGVTDSNANNWAVVVGSSSPQMAYARNATPGSGLVLTLKVTERGSGNLQLLMYDVVNADPNPYVQGRYASGPVGSGNPLVAHAPDLTPQYANGVVFASLNLYLGPPSGMTSPSGVVFDSVYYNGATDLTPQDSGDGYAHVYPTSTAPLNFTWRLSNGGQSTYMFGAAWEFKPPQD